MNLNAIYCDYRDADSYPVSNSLPTWMQARIFSTIITAAFLVMLYFSPASLMAKTILFFVPGIFAWGFCLVSWKIRMVR